MVQNHESPHQPHDSTELQSIGDIINGGVPELNPMDEAERKANTRLTDLEDEVAQIREEREGLIRGYDGTGDAGLGRAISALTQDLLKAQVELYKVRDGVEAEDKTRR